MRPQYISLTGFTVVLTPHCLEQLAARAALVIGARLSSELFTRIFSGAAPMETVAIAFGRGLLYARKQFNSKRGRWELEFISFTPNQFVQTQNNRIARLLTLA